MTWRVTTPPAQTGSAVVLSGAGAVQFQTVAQLAIESWGDRPDPSQPHNLIDTREAIACTIYFSVDVGASLTLTAGEKIQWKLQWGYGGITFEELWEGNAGSLTKVGNYFRISAVITPATASGTVGANSTAKVRAMCVPARPSGERNAIVTASQTPGATGTIQPPIFGGPASQQGTNPTAAVTLLRLYGWNYGNTAAYLMLFDGVVANTAVPRVTMGYVQPQGSVSLDVYPTGIPFSKFCYWAASSTGDTLTNSAAATFNLTADMYLRAS
jgi:hypothetical protein